MINCIDRRRGRFYESYSKNPVFDWVFVPSNPQRKSTSDEAGADGLAAAAQPPHSCREGLGNLLRLMKLPTGSNRSAALEWRFLTIIFIFLTNILVKKKIICYNIVNLKRTGGRDEDDMVGWIGAAPCLSHLVGLCWQGQKSAKPDTQIGEKDERKK
ncbi:hypothetical protein ACVRXQ_07035 [Streptococcus panodentis]|uniref:hypothetical protein n=1 Tax=Streptococcus panodentis TaxID=1581472 RepID=UPI001AE41A32|nr:hypothetical protein [Streptococcus panodentis]